MVGGVIDVTKDCLYMLCYFNKTIIYQKLCDFCDVIVVVVINCALDNYDKNIVIIATNRINTPYLIE